MKNKKNYGMLLMLCLSLVWGSFANTLSPMVQAWAVETETEDETEETPKEKVDKEGRPILGEGETGILIEAATGNVLMESESQKRMYPASTTKVMTALLAVEAMETGAVTAETEVTITEEMLQGLDPDGSNIALKAGEILTLKHLLYGLMIPSGNDAAIAIAHLLGGSEAGFVEKMNQRAAELGLADTHFVNPHGLHDENHYTTAADMAKIARAAMGYEAFRDIADIAHIKIPPTNMTEKERYYINTNGLISAMRYLDYYYPKSTGIKTGYTSQAGNCLVASASDKGMDLITVLFNGKGVGDSHKDSIRMLDYGFANYEVISPISRGRMLGEIRVKQGRSKDSVTLSATEGISVVAPKGTKVEDLEFRLNLPESVTAPVVKGQNVGTVSILLEGQELGQGSLSADIDVARSFFWPALALGEWLWHFLLIRTLVYLFLTLSALILILAILRFWRELKKMRRRKEMRQNRQERK